MIHENTLYITLQYLRIVEGQRKYHWGLYNSGSRPPAGYLVHATDVGRAPLDLYKDVRPVSNPLRSGTMVVVLKIAHSPGMDALEFCAESVRLMDRRHLPSGESQWTCRVWVKEVLKTLQRNGYIQLPSNLDTVEQCCQYAADSNIGYMGNARVYNDLSWMETGRLNRATLIDIDVTGGGGRSYYGSSPMVIDSSGAYYYGSKPMIVDSSRGSYFG